MPAVLPTLGVALGGSSRGSKRHIRSGGSRVPGGEQRRQWRRAEGSSAIPVAAHTEIAAPVALSSSTRTASFSVALRATALHAAGYLIVTALIALVVYEKLGLALLRKAWLNLDLLWAATLIATGLIGVLV